MKSLGSEAVGKMLDSVVEIISVASGTIGVVVSTGKFAAEIADYVEWYMDNTKNYLDFRDDLQKALTNYCIINPDCKYISMDTLSLEQLNELNKKYNNPDYNLILE